MRDLADELLQAKVKARLFGGDHAPRLGRLVILDRIGAGAMGTVYTAYDPRLDRKVAVKVLHAADADANARFLREARTLAQLAHPNVVAIHDADERDGAVFLVMELATGVPLRTWIASDRDWRDIVRVMREIAGGLAAAHRAGLVHRDIKPDNILVGSDRALLVDFGLARGTDTDDAPAAGTPSYMAPEVLAGDPASPASDQFSFGVTLFEALHGERPHAGTTRAELRDAALHAARAHTRRSSRDRTSAERADTLLSPDAESSEGPPQRRDRMSAERADTLLSPDAEPSSSETTPRRTERERALPVPAWVNAIVRRTLAAEPAQRFASMTAVAAALASDPARRRRVVAMVVVGVLVGGGAGAIAYRSAGTAEVASCEAGARRVAVWDAAREHEVRAALGDVPWAPRAVAALGDTAARWDAGFRTVCEATRVTGAQSDRLLELRMRCLDRALDRLGALATVLSTHLDAGGRAEAASAIAQLPDPQACVTIADDAELQLPTDPAARAEAVAVERDLDRAWAKFALGRYRDARDEVTALDRRTLVLDAPPQRAAVLLLAATVEARIGEPAIARAALDRALAAAARTRSAELEYAVWSKLLRHELFAGTPGHVIEWAAFARAAATRAGHEGADVDGVVGEALRKAGQLDAAREHTQRALASHDPQTAEQRAVLEMNLGSIDLAAGRPDAAQAAFERARDITQQALGDGHPSLGVYLDKLAHALAARGRIAEALALHDRSLAIRIRALGEDDRAVATARFYRAETLLAAGQLDRAQSDLEAARALRLRHFGERSPRLGEIDAALGDVAVKRGDPAAARTLYERARTLDPRLDLEARLRALPR